MKFLEIVKKDFKIILRNPMIFSFLIIVPILFMIVIGYTYSAEKFTDIRLGIVGDREDFSDIVQNTYDFKFFGYEDYRKYNCLEDLRIGMVDLCIEVEKIENIADTYIITFNTDNSKIKLSDMLVNIFSKQIEKKVKESQKEKVQNVLDDVNKTYEDLLFFEEEYLKKSDSVIESIDDDLNEIIIQDENIEDGVSSLRDTFQDENKEKNNMIENVNAIEEDLEFATEHSVLAKENYVDLYRLINEENPELYEEHNEIFFDLNQNIAKTKVRVERIDNSFSEIKDAQYTNNKKTFDETFSNLYEEIENIDENNNNIKKNFETIKNNYNGIKEFYKTQTDDSLESLNTNANSLVEPVKIFNKLLYDTTYIKILMPDIIVMMILFLGVLFSNSICLIDKNPKTNFKNYLSLSPQIYFVLGKLLISIIFISIQLIFLFFTIQFFFGIDIISNIFELLLFCTLLLVFFSLLGIFSAFLFVSNQLSILFSTFAIMFLFLLSEVIFPLKLMPKISYLISLNNPVYIGKEFIRQIFFDQKIMLSGIVILSIEILVLFILCYIVYKKYILKTIR